MLFNQRLESCNQLFDSQLRNGILFCKEGLASLIWRTTSWAWLPRRNQDIIDDVHHAISNNDVGNGNRDKAIDFDDNKTGEPRYINAEMVVVEKGGQVDLSSWNHEKPMTYQKDGI